MSDFWDEERALDEKRGRNRRVVADLLDRLRVEILRLHETDRVAVTGHLCGTTNAETARRIGKSREAVRLGVKRAYRKLGYGDRASRLLDLPTENDE